MRMRHKPWADEYINENDDIVVLKPETMKGNWKNAFPKEQPIHLEIGTGKGQFIANMAKQHPENNFVGIEIAKSVIVTAIEKVKDTEVDNVRLVNGDAQLITDLFAENEIETIYLNFSDPWPKNRHEKRRLTYKTFLQAYQNILNPTGEIVLKTDNQHLFEYSVVSFSQFGMLIEELILDLHAIEDPLNVMTEYEEKFSQKGQPIYRCRAKFR